MGEKRFAGLNGSVTEEAICTDYENAARYDKLRVGERGVYFRDGLRLRFLAYEELERVFIRVNQVNARCCCGNTKYDYYRIVFVRGGKEIGEVLSEKEKETDDALAAIRQKAPFLAIGTGETGKA